MAPNAGSAAAAVAELRAQIEMANGALEAIDRRAALVPATLGIVAGIFIGSDDAFTTLEAVALLGALVTGIVAALSALRVLWTRNLSMLAEIDGLRQEQILPDASSLERITRYEAALERSLLRTLHELQRLQAARQGGASAPIAVDIDIRG